MLTRAYAAVLKIVELPFATVGTYRHPIPFASSHSLVARANAWQGYATSVLGGTGPVVVGLALAAVSATNVRLALLLLTGLLYFAGYPAIFFDARHFFHLEFIAW